MDIINIPMGYIIRFCNNLVGNRYVWALLLIALIFEVILLPFGIKQQKNSIKQARLRPKEMAIRKKYAGREDQATKQKVTMEIQELYQKEGYNPMGGCLPLLIQFPIIIALYNVVMNPLRYICQLSTDAIEGVIAVVKSFPQYADKTFTAARNIDLMDAVKSIIETEGVEVFSHIEGFSDKITGVADLPNLTVFGGAINLAQIPSFTSLSWLILIPVLTFLSYFYSMKINHKLMYQPAATDAATGCSNKMMDWMMPLISVFFTFTVPAALGVYWIFKCVLGVGKQALLTVAMPLPKFTDEDYAKAEKEYNVKPEKNKSRSTGTGKVRSLHHIDDEDYEQPAPKAPQKEESAKKEPSPLLGKAPLKEDAPAKKSRKGKKAEPENDNEANGEEK